MISVDDSPGAGDGNGGSTSASGGPREGAQRRLGILLSRVAEAGEQEDYETALGLLEAAVGGGTDR